MIAGGNAAATIMRVMHQTMKASPMHKETTDSLTFSFSPLPESAAKPENGADATSCTACPWRHIPPYPWALPRKPFRKRHPLLFWGLATLLLLIGLGAYLGRGDDLSGGDKLAVVRVEGMIADTRPLLAWIDKVRRAPNVKGVLLRIDSPGGGAAASQELYEALHALSARKPVVASMGSVAASGGLMAAMGASYVVANPSTVTGSIGVKMELPQLQGLMQKIGVGRESLSTGRFKDAGSPFRPLTAEERTYLDGVLQDMHRQFVALVAENRKLPLEKVQAMADGRIFTGRAAKALGLVDELGGPDAALRELRKQTGVAASVPLLERPRKNKLWKEVLESVLDLDLDQAAARTPAFLFQ